ncbi:hypothetical protein C8R46DRAFT_1344689 [Mycena filopes]|nr:hypothetical protein C8R46DRAFT_1344689 [Mycena filopes]
MSRNTFESIEAVIQIIHRFHLDAASENAIIGHLFKLCAEGAPNLSEVLRTLDDLPADPFEHVGPGYLRYLREHGGSHFRNSSTADCNLIVPLLNEDLAAVVPELHIDFLTARSGLFRRLLRTRSMFLSVAASIGMSVPSHYLEISPPPHLDSLLLFLEWMYSGDLTDVRTALIEGAFSTADVRLTVEYLELRVDEGEEAHFDEIFLLV